MLHNYHGFGVPGDGLCREEREHEYRPWKKKRYYDAFKFLSRIKGPFQSYGRSGQERL